MWRQPPFDQLAHHAELVQLPWDAALAALNARADAELPAGLRFAEQDATLAADGLSYEQRIAERRLVAMRRDSLHDLYGALMWLQWPRSKWAIHEGQYAGIVELGPKQRSRHQQALTHIDEAGLLVVSTDASLLDALQAHHWHGLLIERRADWAAVQVWVIGHALFELRQCRPHDLLAAKVIPVLAPAAWLSADRQHRLAALDACVAQGIASRQTSADPKDQSTLPLAAVVGWDERNVDPGFIASAACFRPKPPGRVYAPALQLT